MSKKVIMIVIITGFILLGTAFKIGNLQAQENETNKPVREQLRDLGVNIPFIDRDGDGINDLLQKGWGLQFLNRYRKRQALWEELNAKVVEGESKLVASDGDGVGDIPFPEFLRVKMKEMVDTDKDGKPDTMLGEFLGKRFQSLDFDGDGLPDDITREELHLYMQDMREWHNQIRDRIQKGMAPFLDEDGDGIPDNVPMGHRLRGPRGGPGGGPGSGPGG